MSRKYHLLTKFGITEEQYQQLYDKQNGCCAICGEHSSKFKNKLAVEHDHTSKFIRGLACYRCNKFVIGRYRKETSYLLLKAYEYLNQEHTGWLVPLKKPRKKKRHGKSKVRRRT